MIYISGKISGEDFTKTWDKFQEAESKLHAFGVKVINPMKLGIPITWSWEQQMKVCLEVFNKNATGIFLLKDWTESKGARREFEELNNINSSSRPMSIYYEKWNGYNNIRRDVEDKVLTCLIPE